MMLEMRNLGQWALQGLSVKLGIYSLKLNGRFMQVKPLLFTWRVLAHIYMHYGRKIQKYHAHA